MVQGLMGTAMADLLNSDLLNYFKIALALLVVALVENVAVGSSFSWISSSNRSSHIDEANQSSIKCINVSTGGENSPFPTTTLRLITVFKDLRPRVAMSTQYDTIGSRYKAFKERPVVDIEEPSVLKRLGSVEGLTCLDLACGLGHWSRLLARKGASKVIGVDISQTMISSANDLLPDDLKPTISYQTGDCSIPTPVPGGPFDLIFAGWLLNYAPDYATLLNMFRHIHVNLAPGGRFISITPNTHCPMYEPIDDYYGVAVWPVEKVGDEGWKCHLKAYTEPEPVEFEMYHFLHGFYERAAKEAGLGEVRWWPPVMPEDERREGGFWDVYLLRPHMLVLTASRE
ncbi:uncharacterized protein LTR77_001782 [Saxophila tyrrhenica]|uniref:Methyltransferase domain-containing protein n=1 Tax=Saxophila tyrrhenica TaxID=1690608 RepID=A0AAV9PL75_9PEZI|nr:hypothetical protein LTR77_001782 [Saxophila tyrrhenica]